MAQPTPPELILRISLTEEREKDGECQGEFRASVHRYRAEATWITGYVDHLWSDSSLWAGFAMRADYSNLFIGEGPLYGLQWGYHEDLVQLHAIDHMAQGLKAMKGALETIVQADGPAQSLGHGVLYVMRAMGMTKACWQLESEGLPGWRWYLSETPAEIRAHIDAAVTHCTLTPRHGISHPHDPPDGLPHRGDTDMRTGRTEIIWTLVGFLGSPLMCWMATGSLAAGLSLLGVLVFFLGIFGGGLLILTEHWKKPS